MKYLQADFLCFLEGQEQWDDPIVSYWEDGCLSLKRAVAGQITDLANSKLTEIVNAYKKRIEDAEDALRRCQQYGSPAATAYFQKYREPVK